MVERERDRSTAESQCLLVVGIGVAAFCVQQRRTPGEAGAARHRAQRAPVVGVNESAGKDDAAVGAAEPAVLAFDTDHKILTELVIGAGLHAAKQPAVLIIVGDDAVESLVAAEAAAD